MKGSLRLGSVKDIAFFVHWSFLILVFWIVGNGFLDNQSYFQIGYQLVFVFTIFFCVALHELGHSLAALKYGIKTQDIILLPIGGVARLTRMPDKPSQELFVAIAGPLVNVAIAVVLFIALLICGTMPTDFILDDAFSNNFLLDVFLVNVTLVFFNLIPAFPMDGGRILRALLSMRLEKKKATLIAARLGQLIAVFFVIAGFMGNPSLTLIGVFVFLSARSELNMVKENSIQKDSLIHMVSGNYVLLTKDDTTDKALFILNSTNEVYLLLIDDSKVIGIIEESTLLRSIANSTNQPIMLVANSTFPVLNLSISPFKAYEQLRNFNCTFAPVFDEQKLVGVVTHKALAHHLAMKSIH